MSIIRPCRRFMLSGLAGSRRSCLIVVLAVALLPASVAAQHLSVTPWIGPTEDLKPNPFAGTTERNSGWTVGANALWRRASGRTLGASVGWSRFSDTLHHLDLLAVLRLAETSLVVVDLHGGISRAMWDHSALGGPSDGTSLDFLVGPVLGVLIPLSNRITLHPAGLAQFRWSPDYNDYLRLGARLGLAVSFGS
jgi:hypothetical protein